MRKVGYVNTEGGPLLVADAAEAMRLWRGAEDGGEHYRQACAPLDADPHLQGFSAIFAGFPAVVWDIGGAGTCFVWQEDDSVVLTHHWAEAEPLAAGLGPSAFIGRLFITSGALAVMWAVEDGQSILPGDLGRDGEPSGDLAVGGGVLIVVAPTGEYDVFVDEIAMSPKNARRCTLRHARRA